MDPGADEPPQGEWERAVAEVGSFADSQSEGHGADHSGWLEGLSEIGSASPVESLFGENLGDVARGSAEAESLQPDPEWAMELEALNSDSDAASDVSSLAGTPGECALAPFVPVDTGREDFALTVLHRSQSVPDENLNDKWMGVCSQLVLDSSAVATVTKEASELDIDRRDLRTLRRLLAASALAIERQSWSAFEQRLADNVGGEVSELLFYIDFSSYDIADFKMQVSQEVKIALEPPQPDEVVALANDHPEQFLLEMEEKSSGVKKIVQTEGSTLMLLRLRCGRLVAVRGHTLTWLSVADRSTSECYKACVEKQRLGTAAAENFGMKLRLACTDGDGAIAKAERHIMEGRPGWCGLHLACRVHTLSGCHEKVYDALLSPDISGLYAAAKSLEPAGMMSIFRKSVRKVLAKKLRLVAHIHLDREAVHFKELVIASFLGPHPQHMYLRVVLETCAPGDWRDQNEFLYPIKPGESRNDVLRLLFKTFVPALFGHCPKLFPRHRWTGALDTLRDIGLPLNLNGLFVAAFEELLGTLAQKESGSALAQAPPANVGNGDGAQGGARWASVPFVEAEAGPDPAQAPTGPSGGATWAEQNRAHRGDARSWLGTKPASKMLIMAATLRPLGRFMLAELEVGGAAFEAQEASKAVTAPRAAGVNAILANRKWPLLLAARQESERTCMQDLVAVHDRLVVGCLPPAAMTVETQRLICKLLSKEGACIYDYFITQSNQFPWKLFRLLDDPALAAEIEQSCESSRDEFSHAFIVRFQGRLVSEEALMHLSLIVLVARTSTLNIECRHAQIRRYVKTASVHVQKPDLAWISAKFLLRKMALREKSFRLPSGSTTKPGNEKQKRGKRGQKKGESSVGKRTRRRGGGGAYRAFISAKCKAVGKAVFRELAAEYNALPEDDKKPYQQTGALATILHQQGRPAFGAITRELARAALRSERHQRALARARATLSGASSSAMVPVGAGSEELAKSVLEAKADEHLLKRLDRTEKQVARERLLEWQAGEGHKRRDELVARAPLASSLSLGLVGRPDAGVPLFLEWVCPLQTILPRYGALLAQKEHKQVAAVLLKQWHDLHLEKRDADQVELPPPPRQNPNRKLTCLQAGICLCGAAGDDAHSFKLWLDRAMKAMTAKVGLRADLASCAIVLRLQKRACGGQGGGAGSDDDGSGGGLADAGATNGVDMFFLIAHLRLKPYKPTFRRLTYDHTDATGLMHFQCRDEYCALYELAMELQPQLTTPAIWEANFYRTDDSRQILAHIHPRRLRVKSIPDLLAESKRFPVERARRRGRAAADDALDGWDAELELLDEPGSGSDDASDVDMAVGGSEAEENSGEEGEGVDDARSASGSSVANLHDSDGSSPASSPVSGPGSALSDDCSACEDEELESASAVSVATSELTVLSFADLETGMYEEAPPATPAREAPATGAPLSASEPSRLAEVTFEIPNLGTLRFYATRNEFVAHCTHQQGHDRCRLSRSSSASLAGNREGQGRPLGLLVAWLQAAHGFQDGRAHVRMPRPDLATRQAAREFLKTLEGSGALLLAERPRRAGEPEEPPTVP